MPKSVRITDQKILHKIFELRGHKIMLDRDLAAIYGVPTGRLNEAVKRNIERFPESFMFRLTDDEIPDLVNGKLIVSKQSLGGSLPYVFTEHGILMLANVLKSKKAIEVSLRIIEIFVQLRKEYLSLKEVLLKLEKIDRKVENQGDEIETLFTLINEIIEKQYKPTPPRTPIGFRTQATRNKDPEMKAVKPKPVKPKAVKRK
ncbi:MAG: hypothetical protein RL660_40 [Bacteroidota bacterium]|jgi:hypothetical protein